MTDAMTPRPVGAPSRLPLFLAIGCTAFVALTCLAGVGAFFAWRFYLAEEARSHATTFLEALVGRDYATAHAASGSTSAPLPLFSSCFAATPLATMTAERCDDVDVDADGHRAHVHCTVTTPSGATVITVDVNRPGRMAYNGFVWFSPDAALGPAWHGDGCAILSGRDYVDEPPVGRVRP